LPGESLIILHSGGEYRNCHCSIDWVAGTFEVSRPHDGKLIAAIPDESQRYLFEVVIVAGPKGAAVIVKPLPSLAEPPIAR